MDMACSPRLVAQHHVDASYFLALADVLEEVLVHLQGAKACLYEEGLEGRHREVVKDDLEGDP